MESLVRGGSGMLQEGNVPKRVVAVIKDVKLESARAAAMPQGFELSDVRLDDLRERNDALLLSLLQYKVPAPGEDLKEPLPLDISVGLPSEGPLREAGRKLVAQ